MAGLVSQNLHAPLVRAALHFEHLRFLEFHQSGMREVEGDRHTRDAIGREPFGREPEVRPEGQTAAGQFVGECRDPRLEPAPVDRQPEFVEPQIEELLVRQIGPSLPDGSGGDVGFGRRGFQGGHGKGIAYDVRRPDSIAEAGPPVYRRISDAVHPICGVVPHVAQCRSLSCSRRPGSGSPADRPGHRCPGRPGGGDPVEPPTYRETVVVSASKTEQQLVDAPATMTVIGPRALEVAPSGNYAELLRGVPGLNITQISARDVNVTSRGAAGSLATSQLAVLDGRSLYQDFFGFVMWDFMPADLDQVKRIEVIRGPASAVWGANALNGVISVITKTPREAQGTMVTIGGGAINREVNGNGGSGGSLFYVRGSHARAVNDRLSYRITTGTYTSDALARPNGVIPNGTNTPFPAYTNTGTSQPKIDVRFDYDFPDATRKLQVSGGTRGRTA